MTKHIELKTVNQGTALATGTLALAPLVIEGLEEFKGSFDRLCLQAGTAAIEAMLAADSEQLCGRRYQRHADRQGHRWGMVGSEVGWHGGKTAIRRPRVRQRGGAELELPSWTAIQKADLLSRWAFNQMLIGVATRKYARSVRLPDGDLAGQARRATTKSSVSRRFVALSTVKLKEWLAADLSELDLLVIQIDGLHVGDYVLVAAIGIDGAGDKHVLALALGATENAAVVKALLADLVERGLQPDIARLFKLAAIWGYQTSPHFSVAERAALDLAVAGAAVPNAATDEMFATLRKHWSDEQIVEIVGVISMFGFLNRWNDTLATPLEDEPIAVGEKFLAPHGWTQGKHGA